MKDNYQKYNQLTVSGQTYSSDALTGLCEKNLADVTTPSWKKEVYQFIGEWVGNKDTVSVQTSGSTGQPKKIAVKKDAMLQSAFNTIDFFGLVPGMSALLCLPASYIAGKMMIVRAFAGQLNLMPVPVVGLPLQYLSAPVDFAAMTPLQMMNELSGKPSRLHFLKKVILGGSAVGRELALNLKNQSFQAWETYGMTETLSHVALKSLNGNEADDFFKPLKDIHVSVDEHGCLVVDASCITNGPVVTNDIAEINENGTFKIKGRADNVINTGGVKVSPEEIESRLSGLIPEPFYVSSRPHPSLGREIILVMPDKPDNVDELLSQLKTVLPAYHAPKDIVVKQPFSMTESGKIKRD